MSAGSSPLMMRSKMVGMMGSIGAEVPRSLRYRLNGAQQVKFTLEGLAAELSTRVLPLYLVSGNEPLLVGEAVDAIRARARSAGFTEREVFFIERGNAVWDAVLQAAQALS